MVGERCLQRGARPLDGVVVPTDSTAAAATGGGLGGGGGAGGGAGGGPAAPGTDVFLAIFGDEDESLGDDSWDAAFDGGGTSPEL